MVHRPHVVGLREPRDPTRVDHLDEHNEFERDRWPRERDATAARHPCFLGPARVRSFDQNGLRVGAYSDR